MQLDTRFRLSLISVMQLTFHPTKRLYRFEHPVHSRRRQPPYATCQGFEQGPRLDGNKAPRCRRKQFGRRNRQEAPPLTHCSFRGHKCEICVISVECSICKKVAEECKYPSKGTVYTCKNFGAENEASILADRKQLVDIPLGTTWCIGFIPWKTEGVVW